MADVFVLSLVLPVVGYALPNDLDVSPEVVGPVVRVGERDGLQLVDR